MAGSAVPGEALMEQSAAIPEMPHDVPSVSVVIPAYNASRSIERAVASVQAQTEHNIEIIVVDDCSGDETAEIVLTLASRDRRVRLARLPQNGGPSAARNKGIDEARGRWLAILDADDVYKPDRLQRLVGFAEQNGLDMVGDDIIYFDAQANMEVRAGNFSGSSLPIRLTTQSYLRSCSFRLSLREVLLEDQRHLSLLKYVIRTDFIKGHRLRYQDKIRYGEDFVFNFEVLKAGAAAMVVPEAYYVYSQQYGSLSKKRSHLTHTLVDRTSVVRAVDELIERHPALTADERALLLQRKASTLGLQEFERARQLVRDRRFAGALGHLLRNPGALPFALLETRRYAQRQLSNWTKPAGSAR